MTLELIVGALVVGTYLLGCFADERRSRKKGKKLRRLQDESKEGRPRMPMPSRP